MTNSMIIEGISYIKQFIVGFDYDSTLTLLTPQALLSRYNREPSAYIKMLILRAYVNQNTDAKTRLRKANDVLRKYVDETFHIENDYIYSLDVRKFNIVPENYIIDADEYVAGERIYV